MAHIDGRPPSTMGRMKDAADIVSKVRRRLLRIRLVEHFQIMAGLTLTVALVSCLAAAGGS